MKAAELMKTWGSKCAYCGVSVWLRTPRFGMAKASVDHFIPLKHGGTSNRNNLVLSCAQCNISKSGISPEQWLPQNIFARVQSYLANIELNKEALNAQPNK